ncbi:MAG: acyl-CoA/acyl-ACP dehydrogenase, partial [Ectothiorhodospiraceae bacterium]|nr:acyl-CoA/acyl-ACP dehydrogenase [Ectothiorhodospiraceae bacterium]
MDLDFSEEQTMLVDMVRRLCEDTVPLTALRTLEGREPGYSEVFWSRLSELGITGLWIPEAFGGLELGALEAALVHEQFGRSLAVSPHLASSMLSARLLALAGDASQREHWLPAIAAGSAIVTVAALEPGGGFGADGIQLRAQPVNGGYRLSGTKHFVAFASVAAALLVLARCGDDPEQVIGLLVKPDAEGLSCHMQFNHAGEPCYKVVFENVQVELADVLNEGCPLWDAWSQSMFGSLIPLAARAVGAATCVHEISVAYAREREAFGRPIGGFQSIAH